MKDSAGAKVADTEVIGRFRHLSCCGRCFLGHELWSRAAVYGGACHEAQVFAVNTFRWGGAGKLYYLANTEAIWCSACCRQRTVVVGKLWHRTCLPQKSPHQDFDLHLFRVRRSLDVRWILLPDFGNWQWPRVVLADSRSRTEKLRIVERACRKYRDG